jgi:hypothetical protein
VGVRDRRHGRGSPAGRGCGSVGRSRRRLVGFLIADAEQPFQEARAAWRAALRGHVLAPPDAGFSARLAALAAAARQRAAACEAAYGDGFEWPPARGVARPPYELRPGSGRRGPAGLWERLTRLSRRLTGVSEGRSLRAVARAYAELGDVAGELAAAVEREDRASGLLPSAVRKRRKSA